MDWLATVFLVLFFVGLVMTVVMAVMSGAFEHEFGSGSSFEGGAATDLGGPDIGAHPGDLAPGQPEVGWAEGHVPGFSPWSPTVLCAALTGAGGIGYLSLKQWDLGPGAAVVLGLAGGLGLGAITFFTLAWAFAKLQASSHVDAVSMIGQKAAVTTAIEPGHAGAVGFVAGGSRMVVPARCTDAARVPEGAEVEIVRIDGAVYVVKETRESWLRRSKEAAQRPTAS